MRRGERYEASGITSNERKIETTSYCSLQVKCPSLMTDGNENRIACRTCLNKIKRESHGKCPEWKWNNRRNMFPQVKSPLHNKPSWSKDPLSLAHACRCQARDCKMIPRVETEIRTERYFVFYVQCPGLLNDHNKIFSVCSEFEIMARCGVSGKSLSGNRDRDEKILRCPHKVHCITQRSQVSLL